MWSEIQRSFFPSKVLFKLFENNYFFKRIEEGYDFIFKKNI